MRFYFSAVLLGGAIFFIDPRLDLAFSALFYQPEVGFVHANLMWVQWSYRLLAWLQFPILGVLATGLLAGWFSNRWAKHQRAVWFLILALLIGPGVVVNEGLKNHWGRARPAQVVEFGGTAIYTPPWQISDQCAKNCSMSSGHAALGFYPMALAWVFRRQRKAWLVLGLTTGAVVGLGRILQGGHFLSDILVSAAVVWLVCELLARLMLHPAKSTLAQND
jgi:lipid A 4'-phosphatase